MPRTLSVVALVGVAVCGLAASALAQTPAHVRVVINSAPIQRWLHAPATDVLLTVDPGTTLAVLDQEKGWYWVVVPPDAHGTRRAGWIRAGDVERVTPEAPTAQNKGQRPEPEPRAEASSAQSDVPPAPANVLDKVTISERRDGTASSSVNAPAATREYTFEDVHFERDRYSISQDDMDLLRGAVTALKADPSLMVNIEGYTCSLGATAYNFALGARRANAVKEYLVSEGISADRLFAVSRGEEHAQHDNTREETRRLNRRVALVPNAHR